MSETKVDYDFKTILSEDLVLHNLSILFAVKRFPNPADPIVSPIFITGDNDKWLIKVSRTSEVDTSLAGGRHLFGGQQNQNHYAFELMLVESEQTKVQAQLCVTILNNQTHEELTKGELGFKQFKVTESNSLNISDKVGGNELTLRIDIEVISDKIQNKVNNNLLSNLKMLMTDEKFCDFKFIVENEEFKVHKNILSIRSNVFAAMFENNMIEKNINECKIDDIESDVFQELLSFIYTGKSAKIKSMARKLLIASEKYNISELKSICEGVIYNDLNSENAIESLLLADKYNAIELRDKIINFIANNLPTIRETTPDLRLFIDKNPDLVVKIFGAIK